MSTACECCRGPLSKQVTAAGKIKSPRKWCIRAFHQHIFSSRSHCLSWEGGGVGTGRPCVSGKRQANIIVDQDRSLLCLPLLLLLFLQLVIPTLMLVVYFALAHIAMAVWLSVALPTCLFPFTVMPCVVLLLRTSISSLI